MSILGAYVLCDLKFFLFCCSDTFDENTPPTDDPDYISSLGAATFKGMQSGDENAVWLMQVEEITLLQISFAFKSKSCNRLNIESKLLQKMHT